MLLKAPPIVATSLHADPVCQFPSHVLCITFACAGASEDHSIIGRDGEKSFQRFDSFNSVKTDVSRRRGFGSDDEADPFGPFGGTGPFGAGGQTPKHTDVWSAF